MGTLCNKENTEVALVHSIRVCGPLPSCFDTLLCAKLASVGLEDEPTGQKSCIFLYFPERKWKAYGTRCSQAVPHPSTILARRCLTSVIRRERVCSSWYGRRRWIANWTRSHYKTRMLNVCYSYINGVHAGARHKDKNIAIRVDPRRALPSYR